MDATAAFRKALREATDCSVETVARAAGYSRTLFDRYLNRTAPSTEAVRALADALETRAERLRDHARRLREAADERPDGGGAP